MAVETSAPARPADKTGGALKIVRDHVVLDVCIGVFLSVVGAGGLAVREGLAVDQALDDVIQETIRTSLVQLVMIGIIAGALVGLFHGLFALDGTEIYRR